MRRNQMPKFLLTTMLGLTLLTSSNAFAADAAQYLTSITINNNTGYPLTFKTVGSSVGVSFSKINVPKGTTTVGVSNFGEFQAISITIVVGDQTNPVDNIRAFDYSAAADTNSYSMNCYRLSQKFNVSYTQNLDYSTFTMTLDPTKTTSHAKDAANCPSGYGPR